MTYQVKEVRAITRAYVDVPILAKDFPRRSAAETWLIDYLRERKLTIICREIDKENDAIDFMTDTCASSLSNRPKFNLQPVRNWLYLSKCQRSPWKAPAYHNPSVPATR